jgi:hypothetical protein
MKDIKKLCNLYELDYNKVYAHRDDYLVTINGLLELDILQNVLSNLKYLKGGAGSMSELRTYEGKVMAYSVSEGEYDSIKAFNLNKLNSDIKELNFEERKAKEYIVDMIIPKIFIQFAENYNEKRYNDMLDRLYA